MDLNKKLKLRNDKAVSSVIGVILMVAITVALASTVYIYMAGTINVNPQVKPSVRFIQDNSKCQLQVFSASPENINWEDFTISWKISSVDAYLNPGNEPLTNGGGMPSQLVYAGQLINFNGPTDDVIIRHSPTNTLMGMWSFPGTSGGSSGDDGGDDDEPIEYTLSISVVGSGSVTRNPDQSTYSPGDSVELTANANSGWSFSGWSGDLSGSDNPEMITMNGNMNIVATFTENQPVEIDLLIDDFESGNLNKWNTDWELKWNVYTSPMRSVECDGNDNDLISNDLNTEGALSITISFRYRVHEIDSNDNVYVQYYDGNNYNDIEEIGDDLEDTWLPYSDIISNAGGDAQYFISNFRLRIRGSSIDSTEYLWVDDVLIQKIS